MAVLSQSLGPQVGSFVRSAVCPSGSDLYGMNGDATIVQRVADDEIRLTPFSLHIPSFRLRTFDCFFCFLLLAR